MPVPELVFAADYLVFGGCQVLPAVLNVVCQVGALFLFAFALRRSPGIPGSIVFASVCLSAVLLAWPGVTFVLSEPFLLQWLLLQAAVMVSLLQLTRGNLLGAIAAAIVATFCMANGLALWPILIVFSLLRRESVRRLAILCTVFVLTTCIYFLGYRNLNHFKSQMLLEHPGNIAAYFVRYLSMPFGAVDVTNALVMGILSIAMLAAAIYFVWRKRLFTEAIPTLCIGVCLLTLFTDSLTSLSRVPVERTWQGSSEIPAHYLNVSLYYWVSLVILGVFVLCRIFPRRWPSALFLMVFALAAANQQPRMWPWTNFWMKIPTMYRFAALSLESGIDNDMVDGMLYYPDLKMVPRSLAALASRHISIYRRSSRFQWIGKPSATLFRRTGTPALGGIVSANRWMNGYKITGWTEGHWSDIVLLDGKQKIIGVGEHFTNEWDDLAQIPASHAGAGWIGFTLTMPAEACVVQRLTNHTFCYGI
jgi:hypothetical protein